jgi:diguanylate cyclase (GGDEF)-like protein
MPVRTPDFSAEEIDRSLAQGGFSSRAAAIDCGACGYATCVAHAEAVLLGNSSWDSCLPRQSSRLSARVADLSGGAMRDGLTGLWNRKMFTDRVVEEVARAQRYGTQLSLLMIRLEGPWGGDSPAGDRRGLALKRFADRIEQMLRVADFRARYDHNRFAVLLPGMNKTSAWAVAEKLRGSGAAPPMPGADDAESDDAGPSLFIGVAEVTDHVSDATALVEASITALERAKAEDAQGVWLSPDTG